MSARKKRRRREVDMKRERKKERDISASTPSSVRRHEEREKERKRRFGINAIISQETDDGVDAEMSLSFFLSLFMSTSLLCLFFSRSLLGQ